MSTAIELYESMSDLSGRMVLAARANEWDELSDLEAQVAHLRDILITDDRVSLTTATPMDEATRKHKVALINKILADDREIRSYAQPWMEAVRDLLSGSSRQRAVNAAYGVSGGY